MSNGSLVTPAIASEGIQEIDVTADSTRTKRMVRTPESDAGALAAAGFRSPTVYCSRERWERSVRAAADQLRAQRRRLHRLPGGGRRPRRRGPRNRAPVPRRAPLGRARPGTVAATPGVVQPAHPV